MQQNLIRKFPDLVGNYVNCVTIYQLIWTDVCSVCLAKRFVWANTFLFWIYYFVQLNLQNHTNLIFIQQWSVRLANVQRKTHVMYSKWLYCLCFQIQSYAFHKNYFHISIVCIQISDILYIIRSIEKITSFNQLDTHDHNFIPTKHKCNINIDIRILWIFPTLSCAVQLIINDQFEVLIEIVWINVYLSLSCRYNDIHFVLYQNICLNRICFV